MPINEDQENANEWVRFGMKLGVQSLLHPFEYSKVLIQVSFSINFSVLVFTKSLLQIGFEPIAPRATTTVFGKPALALPNIFQYVSHIKSVDGLVGCYRGLAPKLVGNILGILLLICDLPIFNRNLGLFQERISQKALLTNLE